MNSYKRYYKNANRRAMESLFRDLQLTLIYALLYPLQKEGSNLYYLNFKVTATIIIRNLSKISQISNSHPISSLNPSSISVRIKNLPLATLVIF